MHPPPPALLADVSRCPAGDAHTLVGVKQQEEQEEQEEEEEEEEPQRYCWVNIRGVASPHGHIAPRRRPADRRQSAAVGRKADSPQNIGCDPDHRTCSLGASEPPGTWTTKTDRIPALRCVLRPRHRDRDRDTETETPRPRHRDRDTETESGCVKTNSSIERCAPEARERDTVCAHDISVSGLPSGAGRSRPDPDRSVLTAWIRRNPGLTLAPAGVFKGSRIAPACSMFS